MSEEEYDHPPGSDEAIERGCNCPVLDNNHGKGNRFGSYTIILDCPVHGEEEFQ